MTTPMVSPASRSSTVPTMSPCLTGAATDSGRWKNFWVTVLSDEEGRMVIIWSSG